MQLFVQSNAAISISCSATLALHLKGSDDCCNKNICVTERHMRSTQETSL